LAFADKKFFKNLEEVKKVIHAKAVMRKHHCGRMNNMGFDCIKLIYG